MIAECFHNRNVLQLKIVLIGIRPHLDPVCEESGTIQLASQEAGLRLVTWKKHHFSLHLWLPLLLNSSNSLAKVRRVKPGRCLLYLLAFIRPEHGQHFVLLADVEPYHQQQYSFITTSNISLIYKNEPSSRRSAAASNRTSSIVTIPSFWKAS